jgi:hypothetical protein
VERKASLQEAPSKWIAHAGLFVALLKPLALKYEPLVAFLSVGIELEGLQKSHSAHSALAQKQMTVLRLEHRAGPHLGLLSLVLVLTAHYAAMLVNELVDDERALAAKMI